MAIKFTCPHCQKSLKVKDQMAGKKGPCPECRKLLTVPAQTASPAAKTTGATMDLDALAVEAIADQPKAAPEAPAVVEFTCPYCDAAIKVNADLAGKRAPCPDCKRVVPVPQLKKTAPVDWRKPEAQVGPSGVRRENATPEGAWGNQAATAVSRQALVEAKVVPDTGPRVTVTQWVTRGTVAVLVLGVVGAGAYGTWRFMQGKAEDQTLALAEKALAEGQAAQWPPAVQVELYGLIGAYYQRAGKTDAEGRGGLPRLQLARQAVEQVADPAERIALVRLLARLLIEARAPAEDLGAAVALAPPGAARLGVLREVAAQLLAGGPDGAETLRQVAQRAVPLGGDGSAHEAVEQANAQATVGQELLRAGQAAPAAELAEAGRAGYQAGGPVPVTLQALLLQLNKPGLEEIKDAEAQAAAQAEQQARAGQFAKARETIDREFKAPTVLHVQVLVDVAAAALDKGAKEDVQWAVRRAATLLEPLRPEETLWARIRMVELLAAAAPAEAEAVIGRWLAGSAAGQAWARGEILRQRWQAQLDAAIDPAQAAPLAGVPGAHAAALAGIGRHNARLDPAAARRWVQGLEDPKLQACAAAGAALGMNEKRKP